MTEDMTNEEKEQVVEQIEDMLSFYVNQISQMFNLDSVDVHLMVRAKPEGDDPGNIIFHVGTANLSDDNLIPAIMNTDMSHEKKVPNASDK